MSCIRTIGLLGDLNSYDFSIELVEFETNDLWLRDMEPTFVTNESGKKAAINFNFNGWGEDQIHDKDEKVAAFIAEQSNVEIIQTDLVLEGGCFEIDGKGTAIMTESCILNDNRNPNKSKAEVETELKSLLGLEKIIWLKGIKGKDITDGHTDFYARFAKPGVVIVSRDTDPDSYDKVVTEDNIKVLQSATDKDGNPLEIIVIDTPEIISEEFGTKDFAAGYIGYYVCNGAIIAQKFGDEVADKEAKDALQKVFPNYTIEQIAINGIASGGGSIHCATQQEPKG
ncbi:MAG: Agmatine deiminase (EC [uncultured Sulfurovum sp.]|uniref:Agmatine deiminase (EC) n=1 Tax=uncultured Sulfurovum sp. TaxID=269237 RepID=A0A6S6TTE8_9BACT|nr:MAG: Agmatine deiminase (EC [uncultured Sulfurovum sp.]